MTASRTAHITMALDGQPNGVGDIDFTSPLKLAVKKRLADQDLQVVLVEGVAHMKGPPGTTRKPWFVVKLDPKAGLSLDDLFSGADPRRVVSTMRGVTGKDMGPAQVSGFSTRRYVFMIPISTFLKGFGPAVRKRIQAPTNKPIAVEYSVGDDGLLRRLTIEMAGSGKKVSNETTYSNWGKPVSIVAAPAEQVGPPSGM